MVWGSGLSQKVLGVWRENEKGGQTCAPVRIRRGCFRRVSFVDSPTLKEGTVPQIGLFIRYQLCLIGPGVWKCSDPVDQRLLVTIASEADMSTSDKNENSSKSSCSSTNSNNLRTNDSYMKIHHPLGTDLSAVPSDSFTRTNVYWMPIICKVLWTKYTKASVLKFILVKRYFFLFIFINQGPGISPSEKVRLKQILEGEAPLAGRSPEQGRVPGDGNSEIRDLSAGVCFLCSRSSGSVWLKLLEWLRGKWEGISRAGQSSLEDVVSHCEDLSFYSELNVESLHDFDQNGDLVDQVWIGWLLAVM